MTVCFFMKGEKRMCMKRKMVLMKVAAALLLISCAVSCGKKDGGVNAQKNGSSQISGVIKNNADVGIDFTDLEDFFSLDYTPYVPEAQTEAEQVKLQGVSSLGKTISVIPGLRKLSAYKTDYKIGRKSEKMFLQATQSMKSVSFSRPSLDL